MRINLRRALILTLPLTSIIMISGALAQDSPVTSDPDSTGCPPGKKCLCLRGRPQPRCHSFLVTEFGLMTVVNSSNTRLDMKGENRLSVGLGYMFNISRKDALGATISVVTDTEGDDAYPAFMPRYRRWLSDDIGLDACLGIGRKEREIDGTVTPLVAKIAVSYRDYFSGSILYERIPWTETIIDTKFPDESISRSRTGTTIAAGVTLGSYPAMVAIGVAGLVALFMKDDEVGE